MYSNRLELLIAGVFALAFGGFGLVMLLIYISARMRTAASRTWPSVEGRIDSSRVHSMASTVRTSMTSYMPEVKYTYSVAGTDYQGSHIGFGVPISGLESRARQVVKRHRTGTTCTVYYNPQDPAQAVLERDVENSRTALIVTVACLLVGIGSGVYTLFLLYRVR